MECPKCRVDQLAREAGFRPPASDYVRSLERLLLAVNATAYDGTICHDVDGKNWFDRREELLGT